MLPIIEVKSLKIIGNSIRTIRICSCRRIHENIQYRSKEVVTSCMEMFNFLLPSVCISNRKSNFLRKLSVSDNIICRLCAEYQA